MTHLFRACPEVTRRKDGAPDGARREHHPADPVAEAAAPPARA
jgi:hypothetical protein